MKSKIQGQRLKEGRRKFEQWKNEKWGAHGKMATK